MSKINLNNYYIEEYIYESFSNNSNLIIDCAIFDMSRRLIELFNNGYKVGERHKIDRRTTFIPDTITGEPNPTDYHFLITLPEKLQKSTKDEGIYKFTVMRLLNNKDFIEEITEEHEMLKMYLKRSKDPEMIKKALDFVAEIQKIKPYVPTDFDKAIDQHADRSGIDKDEIVLNQIFLYPATLELIKKYKLPAEYRHLMESFIEKGVDYVRQNLQFITGGSMSYLDYYGSVFYLSKAQDPRLAPEIKARLTSTTNDIHLKRVQPIIQFFQDRDFERTPLPPSDADFENYFLLFSLDKFTDFLDPKKAKIIFKIPKGQPCGKVEIDRITALRRRYKRLLKKYDTK